MAATGELDGTTFLVTGGAGTIGSHVVDRIVDGGAEGVVVLDGESLQPVASEPASGGVDLHRPALGGDVSRGAGQELGAAPHGVFFAAHGVAQQDLAAIPEPLARRPR